MWNKGVFPQNYAESDCTWRQYQWRVDSTDSRSYFYNFSDLDEISLTTFLIFLDIVATKRTKKHPLSVTFCTITGWPRSFLKIPQSAPSPLRRFQPTPTDPKLDPAMPFLEPVSGAHVRTWSSWVFSGDENEEQNWKVIGFHWLSNFFQARQAVIVSGGNYLKRFQTMKQPLFPSNCGLFFFPSFLLLAVLLLFAFSAKIMQVFAKPEHNHFSNQT